MLPVTGLIVVLQAVLVAWDRQVIAAYPDGGGAYKGAREHLGARAAPRRRRSAGLPRHQRRLLSLPISPATHRGARRADGEHECGGVLGAELSTGGRTSVALVKTPLTGLAGAVDTRCAQAMSDRMRVGVRLAAVVAPVVVAVLAGLARGFLANTSAALVLVLVVVVAAVAGDRIAGVLAALSAAASFDFFLTAPYYQFAITDRDDIETAVLLLAIGVAVSEIAGWGRQQHTRSSQRAGYLSGVARAARLAAEGSPTRTVTDTIADMITEVLELDDCRYEPPVENSSEPLDRPVLHRDGTISWAGRTVDVRREGLPAMDVIELPAGHGGESGRFLLTASTDVRRPGREQLLVAVTLAEQVTDPHRGTPATDTRDTRTGPPPPGAG